MPLVNRPQLAERVELIDRRVAHLGHHRVENWCRMPLGEDEAVALHPSGIRGIDLHVVEVQVQHNFHRRERPARMSRLGSADHLDDFPPDTASYGFEFLKRSGHERSYSSSPAGRSTAVAIYSSRERVVFRWAANAGIGFS